MSFLWGKKKSRIEELEKTKAREREDRAERRRERQIERITKEQKARQQAASVTKKSAEEMPVAVAACPSCGIVLDPPPPRSRKCPECGEKIVVRSDRTTKKKLYLTAEGATEFDAAKAAASARKKAIRQVEAIGLTARDYDAKTAELAQEWGHAPSPGDVFWALANEQIARLGSPNRHGWELSQIYRTMAWQLHEEGREHQDLQRESHKSRLILEQTQIKQVMGGDALEWRAEIMADSCCDACVDLDGRRYTFEDAIEDGPLPPDDCTRDWCNCGWKNVHPPF